MSKKVFVGMSGGVDSSVTAAVLLEKGYEVEGINLILAPNDDMVGNKDAVAVAEKLGIPLHIIDLRDEFSKNVIDYFADEYYKGRTPNPCIRCNETIKFGLLLDKALEMGADCIATGHYARIEEDKDRFKLLRSPSKKDQSYFLCRLTQNQLAHTLFPICEFDKEDTRKIAEKHGLPVSQKADSQEICFIPDDDYAEFLSRHTGKTPQPGNFIDMQGNILGQHRGILYYTIGQRKGLGIAFGEPMFVTRIDAKKNEILLAPQGNQLTKVFTVDKMNYISLAAPPFAEFYGDVKIRCQAQPASARITPIGEEKVKIEFETPQRAVTPGQAAVIYDGDIVIGGGYIDEILE